MNENDKQAEPVAWANEIIDDLQGQFDTDGITHEDSGDALIYLSQAISSVQDAAKRHRTQPVQPAGAQGEPVGHFVFNQENGYWVQLDKQVWPNGSPISERLYKQAPPAAINEQLLEALSLIRGKHGCGALKLPQADLERVDAAIAEAEKAKGGGDEL